MDDILDLSGKVALITGAGQGVGRQIALHFAEHGAAGVAVNDYVPERAQLVVDEIAAAGGKAIAVPGDVTDLASVKAMVHEGGAGVRHGRHPGQQCRQRRRHARSRRAQAVLGDRPGGVEQLPRRQSLRRHQLRQRLHPADDRAQGRPHHHHHLRRRPHGRGGAGGLFRRQGRRGRLHPRDRPLARPPRHHRQLHRHRRHDDAGDRGPAQGQPRAC